MINLYSVYQVFLSLLGVALFSRNDVVSFLAHDCSCKSMFKKGGCKSEAFLVKSSVLLSIFSNETFLGNMSSCFSDCFEK